MSVEMPGPVAAPRPRIRRVITIVAAVALVGAGTASALWYHHIATKPVIAIVGYWARGTGVKINDDPVHGAWASIAYTPGAQVTLGMSIFDLDVAHPVTVRSVTFEGLANT